MRAYVFDGTASEVAEMLESLERIKSKSSSHTSAVSTSSNPTTSTLVSPSKKSAIGKKTGGNTKSKTKPKTGKKPLSLGTEPKEKFVDAELVKNVFGRRSIPESMGNLLRNLVSIKPGIWVSTSKLCELMNFSPRQLQGLLVALRRRVAHTPGFKADHHFLDSQLNNETNEYNFRLPQHLRSTIQQILNS